MGDTTPTSSVLDRLANLSPPSPVDSVLLDSGDTEIPIYLVSPSCTLAAMPSPDDSIPRTSFSSSSFPSSSSIGRLSGLSAIRLTHSSSIHSLALPPSSDAYPSFGLPSRWQWLRDVVVELSIDQEGFRAISPEFTLTRLFANSDVSAEFIPRCRQAYNFHYSSLDSAPILRRLTLNNGDTDHISRQANLVIKSNGVYVLDGFEEKGSSCWRFEYLVEDRKSRTGKILSGEKTLTPLRFVCNPDILTPEYGKKIKLLHVVRKKFVSKLTSLKLEPPKLASSQKHLDNDFKLATSDGTRMGHDRDAWGCHPKDYHQ